MSAADVETSSYANKEEPKNAEENPTSPPDVAIYIGNLPYKAREEDLREIFEGYGEITRISIPADTDGRARGYGFVHMANQTAAEDAIRAIDNTDLHGRTLKVNLSKGKAGGGGGERRPRGGRDRDGGRDRGYRRDRGYESRDRDRGYHDRRYDDRDGGRDRNRGGYDDDRRRDYDDRNRGGYEERRGGYEDRRSEPRENRDSGRDQGGYGGDRGYDDKPSGY